MFSGRREKHHVATLVRNQALGRVPGGERIDRNRPFPSVPTEERVRAGTDLDGTSGMAPRAVRIGRHVQPGRELVVAVLLPSAVDVRERPGPTWKLLRVASDAYPEAKFLEVLACKGRVGCPVGMLCASAQTASPYGADTGLGLSGLGLDQPPDRLDVLILRLQRADHVREGGPKEPMDKAFQGVLHVSMTSPIIVSEGLRERCAKSPGRPVAANGASRPCAIMNIQRHCIEPCTLMPRNGGP